MWICGLQVRLLTSCEGETSRDEGLVHDLLQACVPDSHGEVVSEPQGGMGASGKGLPS